MTKKEIVLAMHNGRQNVWIANEWYYNHTRKEAFEKALEIFNTVSKTKGREFLQQARQRKEYRV